jgi:receptor protein-tyrosine kinase
MPILLGATLLGMAAAAAISALQPRMYRSRTTLEIQALNDNFLDLRSVYPAVPAGADATLLLPTQAEVFQQHALLEQVVRTLHLEARPEYQGRDTTVERLRDDLRVEPLRNSRILQISCEAREAGLAAAICNGLAEAGINQAIEKRQQVARETYESLQPRLKELQAASRQAPDTDKTRRFYDSIVEKAGEAWVASRVPQANIRVVDAAEPASRPYRPNLPLNLAIGTAAGLVLGVGWVMLRADNRSVLREPGDAAAHLSVPELGAIPRLRSASDEDWNAAADCFRAMSVSLAARNGHHSRTLVVTSAWPMEGKTTVVHHLGKALAETNQRVLLIDGDTRTPGLHKLFDEANSWGLTDFLREPNAIDELPVETLVKKTPVPHVYLLPSGACPENIFGLLATERMSRMWSRFEEAFDYVLVDAPPCLEFADARMLARHAGDMLLVVRANYTHRRAAQAAVERIRLDGIPMVGVVLNQWDQRRSFVFEHGGAA